jgi:(S)-citramalyl-CoA lyase
MTSLLTTATCLLFVPGHRKDRFDKACSASPQGVVIDLEDAVPPAEKNAARHAVAQFIREQAGKVGAPILVRINAPGTRAGLDDLAAIADGALACDGLVLPKTESPRDIAILRALDRATLPLMAIIETAAGLIAAPDIAKVLTGRDAFGFGGADLSADLGSDFAFEPLLWARGQVIAAAASGSVGAVFDVPFLDIKDEAGLVHETRRVRALGFTGKLAIHPDQVRPVVAAFKPSEDEIAHARRVIEALRNAKGGVATVDGRMIDAPVARAAERTLARS